MKNRFPALNQQTTIPRIVITGAPGSGKTDCLERIRQDVAFAQFVFMDELARQLLEEDPTYRQRWPEFHREIYKRQTARELATATRPFISDRGTVDAFAFHPETAADVGTTVEREYNRYSGVIHLGSAASLGEQHYRTDRIRFESIEEALVIERAIGSVWNRHPGYHWIAAEIDFESKVRQFRQTIERLAGIVRQRV
ncbi:MAG: AAA family ATPase [bacterium]|nr:AAA family ATPase [bacterium]